jgi:hypothetical protein
MIQQPFRTLLLVASVLCFILAVTNLVGGENRVRVIALGLACGSMALIF